MIREKYYPGAGRNQFIYESDARHECPYAAELSVPVAATLTNGRPLIHELVELLKNAYADGAISNRPHVAQLLTAAHHHKPTTFAERTCPACGATARKLGYRTSVLEPGGMFMRLRQGSVRYWPTKREAIAWAREEAAIDKAAKREEVQS